MVALKLLRIWKTNGVKTGLLVPQSQQLFVVHTKTSIDDAGLLVYRVTSNSNRTTNQANKFNSYLLALCTDK